MIDDEVYAMYGMSFVVCELARWYMVSVMCYNLFVICDHVYGVW